MRFQSVQDILKEYDARVARIMFHRQEEGLLHHSYDWEMTVYDFLQHRDTEGLTAFLNHEDAAADKINMGVLAEDNTRSVRNNAICLIAFIAGMVIRDGYLDVETSYSISDACIQIIEEADDAETVTMCAHAGLLRYIQAIEEYQPGKYHHLVRKAKDDVYRHLHEKLTVEAVAERLGVNASYLSHVFRQATGTPLKQFIRRERIYRAQNLLKFSDFSIVEISKYLGFPTQSYFTEVFRRQTGETPQHYRDRSRLMLD